jgi:hypothetical protein
MAVPLEHQHDPQTQSDCFCRTTVCDDCCDEHFTSECLPLLWHEATDRELTVERFEAEYAKIRLEPLKPLVGAMIQARAATHAEAPSDRELDEMYERAIKLYGAERYKQFVNRRLSELLSEFKLSPGLTVRWRN